MSECLPGPEPDQIDMMDEHELRKELRSTLLLLDEIKSVVGFPGTIALEKHGLSESLPDVVRYCHREWLDQTHSSQQRYLQEQSRADALETRLDNSGTVIRMLCHRLAKHEPNAQTLETARKLLKEYGLEGSILRDVDSLCRHGKRVGELCGECEKTADRLVREASAPDKR